MTISNGVSESEKDARVREICCRASIYLMLSLGLAYGPYCTDDVWNRESITNPTERIARIYLRICLKYQGVFLGGSSMIVHKVRAGMNEL
jgi:hypothetical protein